MSSRGGTPVLVWVIYGLGLLALAVFVASGLFVLGAYLLSDDVPVTTRASLPAVVVWGALLVAAAVTWLVRRRGSR